MTLSLILGYALTVLPMPELPKKPEDRMKRWLAQMHRHQQDEMEAFHRQHLEWLRNRQSGMKEMLDWMDKMLDENIAGYTPESLKMLRAKNAKSRMHWEFWERCREELERWEQQRKLNPGPATDEAALERLKELLAEEDAWDRGVNLAPMPRELKR